MDRETVVRELTDIEKSALRCLAEMEGGSEKEVASKGKLNPDSSRRALGWLTEKKLAAVTETRKKEYRLTSEGKEAVEHGLPEQQLLKVLEKGKKWPLEALRKQSGLENSAFNIALGVSKRNNSIALREEEGQKTVSLTPVAGEMKGKMEKAQQTLREIGEGKTSLGEGELQDWVKRGLVEVKEGVERTYHITKTGKQVLNARGWEKPRTYNILDPVPRMYGGKKQPYIRFMDQMREKLVALGFKEMEAPLIVQEFYNFDVLFQPQNHPARTWTDTYQLKWPTHGELPSKKIVKAVKDAHEFGGKTESIGWKYRWSEEIARKVMPAAHCTAHSARQLVEGVEIPGKYFAISRCYRPDVLDATHLIEFNQMDGFIIDADSNFRHLLGMLKQFAVEVAGAEEVKFIPDYYPFTEPSVQLSAKHPEMGWVEFAGAGIFRPEMTESLGIQEPVIAWGIGLDRLAMFKLGIQDIRYLFSEDLQWLRNARMVRI